MKQTIEDLYREHGFKITPHLHDLVATYGSSKVPPGQHQRSGPWWNPSLFVPPTDADRKQIEFCPQSLISVASQHEEDDAHCLSLFMGSPVAPVGVTHCGSIDLWLTEDGRLVGVHDFLVMAWGPRGCDWRMSLQFYLAGAKSRVLGNARPADPLPPEALDCSLAQLYEDNGFKITPHLAELMAAYGESAQVPIGDEDTIRADGGLHLPLAAEESIQFCQREIITRGSDFHVYKDVEAYLGALVAPVGSTGGENITLLLTEHGRLVGEFDFWLTTWGPPGCDWRAAVGARLAGDSVRDLGSARFAGERKLRVASPW